MNKHSVNREGSFTYPIWESPSQVTAVAACFAVKLKELFFNAKIGLVCTGTSGIVIAHELARENTQWRIIYVRKENENAHGGRYKPCLTPDILVVVDDLIASGNTMRRIAKFLEDDVTKVKAVCLGSFNEDIISCGDPVGMLQRLFPNLNHIIY